KRQKSIELPALVSIQEAHIIQPTPTPTPMMESSSPPVSSPFISVKPHTENNASKQTVKLQQTTKIPSTTTTTTPTTTVSEDGWQEVIGKQKKVTIPHEQYSRVIGRSGCNLNVLREVTGASIDVENKRAVGDKTIVIKGNGDSIKHAYQLIMALLKNSESELMSLLPNTAKTSRGNMSSANTMSSGTTASIVDSSSLITDSLHDLNISTSKTQQQLRMTNGGLNTNIGPRFQNNPSTESSTSTTSTAATTTTKPTASALTTSTKNAKTTSRSIPSSSKAPSAIGATWVNSNRSNRANRGENAVTSSATAWNATNALKSWSSTTNHFPTSKASFNTSSGNISAYHTSSISSSAIPTSSYYYNYSNSYHNQTYHYSGTKQYSSSTSTNS
ncbi:unnamed protein product, partial [Didymodactylos carnosus]